jgi:hypothetical protein
VHDLARRSTRCPVLVAVAEIATAHAGLFHRGSPSHSIGLPRLLLQPEPFRIIMMPG